MAKIKQFISNNKKELQVVAYGAVMMCAGFYFGKKFEESGISAGLLKLAKTGNELYTVIDNEVYIMSIVKEQIEK